MKRCRTLFFIAAFIIAAVIIAGCTGSEPSEATPVPTTLPTEPITLAVFHAGSLTAPFEEIEAAFETKYPNVDVQLMPGGSTKVVKDITELGKSADVLASADYTLIPSLMVPDYADYYLTFAKNGMVLCYTDSSLYADEITVDNWYQILAKDDIKWAFSDPNQDPCGYRTPMVLQLAEAYYGDDQIFESTVGANSNITTTLDGDVWTIQATEPEPTGTLSIRPKSVELVQMLEAGGIDYAWEYQSVAVQNNLNFLVLPEAIDLSSVDYADDYAKVQIDTAGGEMKGIPIVYGVTVPTNAEQPAMGTEFIKMLIGDVGQGIMDAQGQPPIVPAGGYGDVPEELKPLVTLH